MSERLRLRASLPDTPRHVEARDLLAWDGSAVAGEPGAFVVWSTADELAVVVGRPLPELVSSAAAERAEMVLLEAPPTVWGAADSNPGSLALAKALGFADAGRLWVASRR